MSSVLISILICIVINFIVSFLVNLFVPDYYLATIITSVIIAFIYSIWETHFDRGHFYRQKSFWINFFGLGILFLIMDFLIFVL